MGIRSSIALGLIDFYWKDKPEEVEYGFSILRVPWQVELATAGFTYATIQAARGAPLLGRYHPIAEQAFVSGYRGYKFAGRQVGRFGRTLRAVGTSPITWLLIIAALTTYHSTKQLEKSGMIGKEAPKVQAKLGKQVNAPVNPMWMGFGGAVT